MFRRLPSTVALPAPRTGGISILLKPPALRPAQRQYGLRREFRRAGVRQNVFGRFQFRSATTSGTRRTDLAAEAPLSPLASASSSGSELPAAAAPHSNRPTNMVMAVDRNTSDCPRSGSRRPRRRRREQIERLRRSSRSEPTTSFGPAAGCDGPADRGSAAESARCAARPASRLLDAVPANRFGGDQITFHHLLPGLLERIEIQLSVDDEASLREIWIRGRVGHGMEEQSLLERREIVD